MNDSSKIKYYICNNELDLEKIINDYSAYVGTIIDNMARCIISDEDKEEICSDVFFILWKNTYKLDINKVLSSYIAGITRNVVKNYLKKNKILYDISDYENSLYSNDKIELLDNNMEEISKIEKQLYRMKEIDKKVFLDFYYSSKSIRDIAKEQNITEFSVKQRLYRIRKHAFKKSDYWKCYRRRRRNQENRPARRPDIDSEKTKNRRKSAIKIVKITSERGVKRRKPENYIKKYIIFI